MSARASRPRRGRGGGEAFDSAVGRARGLPGGLVVEPARLRRDVTRRSPSTAARATVATTPGLHTRTGPSRARRHRDGGLSKHGSRIDSPANPRSQSRASCRRPVSTLKTHKKPAFGRTSAPPTPRDASARDTPPINLTHNLGYTTNPPRAPPPQPFDAAAPLDAAAAPPRKR